MHHAIAAESPKLLWGSIRALRRRLSWYRVVEGTLRGLGLGAAAGLLLLLAAMWEGREPTWLQPHVVASLLALTSLVFALLRAPSATYAARLADRRLDLEDRLATALEILEGRLNSPMAGRQLVDAWGVVQGQPAGRVAPLSALERPALASGALVALFVATLMVANSIDPADNPLFALRRSVEEQVLRSGLFARVLGLPVTTEDEGVDPFAAQVPAPLLNPQTEAQLREQMARSRGQQAALSRLARALTGTAAAREVGEQLQRGNYAQAAAALRSLARENDQLSRQAKVELSEALRQAARETAELSPELARQEERAARALSGRDYRSTQQALERLSQGITDAGREIIPQQELAQAWQRLQEERRGQGEAEWTASSSSYQEGFEEGFQFIEGGSLAPPGEVLGEEDIGMANPANQPGASVGAFNLSGKPTRLNVVGQELLIEGRPTGTGEGRGSSRAEGPAVTLKNVEESGAVLEGVPQPTDPVRDRAERTTIPLGHQRAVHDYFQPGEKAP